MNKRLFEIGDAFWKETRKEIDEVGTKVDKMMNDRKKELGLKWHENLPTNDPVWNAVNLLFNKLDKLKQSVRL
jgi:hypothetical protein